MAPDMVSNSTATHHELPDITVSVREVFGIDSDMRVPAFSVATEHVPERDKAYRLSLIHI